MNNLKWWFRITGIVYTLLGIGFVPVINAQRIGVMIPNFDAPTGGTAFWGLLDLSFMFGLDLIIIGIYLIYCSRDPLKHLTIVYLVIWLEIVRGIIDDIYMIARGYGAGFYIGFIMFHIAVIVTGYLFAKKAKTENAISS
ncbi:MAG: BphX family protein [Ignavibacteria bacterium]|nr:BphX family protein [Ignavibacteria bacterium]